MKLFRKKAEKDNESALAPAKPLSRPTAVDILRYRYHNGTNLGSIYVLEKWLTPSMFTHATAGGSELDAVRGSLAAVGLQATTEKWQRHWQSSVKPEEWAWLREKAHCTTIRLPIGFWTLGAGFCHRTLFGEGDVAQVYGLAWSSVVHLVKTAAAQGIGVLLDLHALPGGANTDSHSGTSQKQADLWDRPEYLKLAQDCAVFIAQEAVADAAFAASLVGIQIVNEASWSAREKGLYEWYDSVIDAVARVDASIPIYVSDAWDLPGTLKWVYKRNRRGGRANPVVVDTHKYFCFGGPNKGKSPFDIIEQSVPGLFQVGDDMKPSKGVSTIVGEWSCVLGETSWAQAPKEQRGPLTKKFGLQQSKKWHEKTGGSLFWTWKMDWMPGGGWGYAKQTNDGNLFVPPVFLLPPNERASRIAVANSQREQRFEAYKKRAGGVLRGKSSGGDVRGWEEGWEDQIAFFANGGVIGLLGAWIVKRMQEGEGREWGWAEGFQAGAESFREVVGV